MLFSCLRARAKALFLYGVLSSSFAVTVADECMGNLCANDVVTALFCWLAMPFESQPQIRLLKGNSRVATRPHG